MNSVKKAPRVALALVAASMVLAHAPSASAENGKLNLHLDLSLGIGVLGPLAFPGKNDNTAILGPAAHLSLDYEVLGPFAVEVITSVGRFVNVSADIGDRTIWSFAVGGRFRFLNDETGYKKDGGSPKSNLWVSVHGGAYGYDGTQGGLDAAVGYEWSLVKPFQLGTFVRGQITFNGTDAVSGGKRTDGAVFIGLSFGFDLIRKIDDTDGDGLADEREEELGTNPTKRDTDGDGLSDSLEVNTGTDPRNSDTDNDGVADGIEDANHNGKVDAGETDPRLGSAVIEDTDEDGVADTADDCPSTPSGMAVNIRGCVAFEGKTLEFRGINFKTGKASILPSSEKELRRAVQVLKDNPEVRVEIGGHTDSRGSAKANLSLSKKRAAAVKRYLVRKGIDASRLETKGYGETKPTASNKTTSGRAKNRRIEFTRLDE